MKKLLDIENLKGYVYICMAASLWGLLGPFGKIAFEQGVSPLEVAFWRAFLAWLMFGSQAVIQRTIHVDKKDLPGLFLFGFVSVALFFGSYQVAVDQCGVALAAVLLYTAPVWVFLLSRIVFKERFTPVKISALFITLAGVALISFAQNGQISGIRPGFSAVFTGLVAGFCYSLYYIMGKHYSKKYSAPLVFLYILPVGAVCLVPGFDFANKTMTAWCALGLIGIVTTYAAYHFYYAGLKRIEAGRASIIATLEPVVAAVVAWFWWGEHFSLTGYAGCLLILISVILIVRFK